MSGEAEGWQSGLPCGKLSGIMARAQRSLLIVHDPKLLGSCTICGDQFTGNDTEIMQKFADHKCSEDTARITREAPEDQ